MELETPEAVQEALKEKDVELSVQEIMQLRDAVVASANKKGELSLDELEGVAGGFSAVQMMLIIAQIFQTQGPEVVISRW